LISCRSRVAIWRVYVLPEIGMTHDTGIMPALPVLVRRACQFPHKSERRSLSTQRASLA
jgi:hypothetical protein